MNVNLALKAENTLAQMRKVGTFENLTTWKEAENWHMGVLKVYDLNGIGGRS